MNQILKKFNFKNNVIKIYENWFLLLRPEQVTFGSMVLIEKNFKKKISNLKKDSFSELKEISIDIEKKIKKILKFDKINYLSLMMIDKEVHLHIIPRYKNVTKFDKDIFKDYGWPTLPNFKKKNSLSNAQRQKLIKKITRLLK
tara:strand:+ start:9913 stop:10341 length:429 start_codon:yes stop_codon:yes gene_type:complete